jgi:hypothetical protein
MTAHHTPSISPLRTPRFKRTALVCLMVIVTLNIWTGSPLLALWVGSRLQPQSGPSMFAIGGAALSLAVFSYALVKTLAWLDAVYGRLTGRRSTVSRHVPWLRSMRGERPHQTKHVRELSPLEIVLITDDGVGMRGPRPSRNSRNRSLRRSFSWRSGGLTRGLCLVRGRRARS